MGGLLENIDYPSILLFSASLFLGLILIWSSTSLHLLLFGSGASQLIILVLLGPFFFPNLFSHLPCSPLGCGLGFVSCHLPLPCICVPVRCSPSHNVLGQSIGYLSFSYDLGCSFHFCFFSQSLALHALLSFPTRFICHFFYSCFSSYSATLLFYIPFTIVSVT